MGTPQEFKIFEELILQMSSWNCFVELWLVCSKWLNFEADFTSYDTILLRHVIDMFLLSSIMDIRLFEVKNIFWLLYLKITTFFALHHRGILVMVPH